MHQAHAHWPGGVLCGMQSLHAGWNPPLCEVHRSGPHKGEGLMHPQQRSRRGAFICPTCCQLWGHHGHPHQPSLLPGIPYGV